MTRYSDYAFDELPQQLFKRKGAEIKEADAMMRERISESVSAGAADRDGKLDGCTGQEVGADARL